MPRTLERKIEFSDLKILLEEVLEEPTEILPETKIKDIIGHPMYLLPILQDLDIPYTKYMSGERLTDEAVIGLYRISEGYRRSNNTEKADHYENLAKSNDVYNFINKMTVEDLLEITQYARRPQYARN